MWTARRAAAWLSLGTQLLALADAARVSTHVQAEEARRSGDRPFGALLVDGLAGAVLFEAKDTVRVKAQQQQPKRLLCACSFKQV